MIVIKPGTLSFADGVVSLDGWHWDCEGQETTSRDWVLAALEYVRNVALSDLDAGRVEIADVGVLSPIAEGGWPSPASRADTRTATALAVLRTGGSYQDAAESSGLTVREVMTAYQASRVTATLNAEYRSRRATSLDDPTPQ